MYYNHDSMYWGQHRPPGQGLARSCFLPPYQPCPVNNNQYTWNSISLIEIGNKGYQSFIFALKPQASFASFCTNKCLLLDISKGRKMGLAFDIPKSGTMWGYFLSLRRWVSRAVSGEHTLITDPSSCPSLLPDLNACSDKKGWFAALLQAGSPGRVGHPTM